MADSLRTKKKGSIVEKEVITNKNGDHSLHHIRYGAQGYASYEEMAGDHMAFHGCSRMGQDHSRDEAVLDEIHTHRQHIGLAADRSRPLVDRDRVAESDHTDPYHSNPAQVANVDDSHHVEGYSCELRGDRYSNSRRGLEDIRDVEVGATEICIGHEDVPPISKQKALRQ